MNIEQSTCFVSGANRGIGKALVSSLLTFGAGKVYAAARNTANLREFDDRVVPLQLDLADPESIQQAAGLAQDVNLLINNAGVLTFGDILGVDEAAIERDFEVNFFGSLRMARAFAPQMVLQGSGAVVNLLTLLSLASMPSMAAYNASKAAAWSMSLSLRASLADKGINVHTVFPGAVNTDMLAGIDMDKTSPQIVAEAIVQGVNDGEEDIFPDPMSKQVYAAWSADHKAVEKQFAQM